MKGWVSLLHLCVTGCLIPFHFILFGLSLVILVFSSANMAYNLVIYKKKKILNGDVYAIHGRTLDQYTFDLYCTSNVVSSYSWLFLSSDI